MAFQFQVLVDKPAPCGHGTVKEWRSVHPTGGQPYQYETQAEADKMRRLCYGNDAETRTIEV